MRVLIIGNSYAQHLNIHDYLNTENLKILSGWQMKESRSNIQCQHI